MVGRMSGLLDPYLKLGRAETHLKSLDVQLKAFQKENPYTITREDDLKTQRHILKTKLAEVPDDITLAVGDALYCMRASLDQLVWSLAKRCGGLVNPSHTQFPNMEVNNSRWRKVFDTQTRGVPDLAIEAIRSLQPYHRGVAFKAHLLWRLHALCNTDKHRRIPANGSEMTLWFPRAIKELVTIETFDDYGITSVPLAMKDKLQFHPRITFQVNFGWGDAATDPDSVSETSKDFWEMHDFIRDTVLPRFIRFFP